MYKQPFCNFLLAGLSLTDYGFEIPSPFSSLEISNSEISSMTSWTLKCIVGGDDKKKINIAAFEALLYGAAQAQASYANASGIPVSFIFGWLDKGQVSEYVSYQGFTLQFDVSTTGLYMVYTIKGYAMLAMQSSAPVLHIPELSGFVQPSAVVQGICEALKVNTYYELDIDHNDSPTMVSHGALNTSFNKYIRGTYSVSDDYESFPGLLRLSKSYNGSRDAAGLVYPYKSVSWLLNNLDDESHLNSYLKKSLTDSTPQCSSFSYWVDEPSMTSPGVIHYKSDAGLSTSHFRDTLEYGTANNNIISLSGSYNGVAYNMTDMQFKTLGFTLDASGNAIANSAEVVNSWSASLGEVFQTVNIINDVNAIASQFSGDFTIQIPGSVKKYEIAQPVSILVASGNTISPITGVYNIVSVSHTISNTFITTLKVQRLTMSSANEVASMQGIYIYGSEGYTRDSYTTTPNIISPYKVVFDDIYPNFEHLSSGLGSAFNL